MVLFLFKGGVVKISGISVIIHCVSFCVVGSV